MPNIAQVLKEEIRRLAKKEARALIGKLKQDVVRLKKSAVATRKTLKQLLLDNELLLNAERRRQRPVSGKLSARITSKGVRAMRKKLGVSQEAFGKLIQVSGMTIFNWERKKGALKVKDATKAAILALRGVGAKEAKRRLELM